MDNNLTLNIHLYKWGGGSQEVGPHLCSGVGSYSVRSHSSSEGWGLTHVVRGGVSLM